MAPSHSDGKDREAGPGGHAHFDCRVVTRRISNAASGLNRQAHSRSSFKINLTRAAGHCQSAPFLQPGFRPMSAIVVVLTSLTTAGT
jgi:hypothetical protein